MKSLLFKDNLEYYISYAFIFACLCFVNFATPSMISRFMVENAEKLTKIKYIRDSNYIVQQIF